MATDDATLAAGAAEVTSAPADVVVAPAEVVPPTGIRSRPGRALVLVARSLWRVHGRALVLLALLGGVGLGSAMTTAVSARAAPTPRTAVSGMRPAHPTRSGTPRGMSDETTITPARTPVRRGAGAVLVHVGCFRSRWWPAGMSERSSGSTTTT